MPEVWFGLDLRKLVLHCTVLVYTSLHKYEIAAYLTKFYDKLKKFSTGNSWKITVAGVMLKCGGRMEDIESK